jgi:hypothetical protein
MKKVLTDTVKNCTTDFHHFHFFSFTLNFTITKRQSFLFFPLKFAKYDPDPDYDPEPAIFVVDLKDANKS